MAKIISKYLSFSFILLGTCTAAEEACHEGPDGVCSGGGDAFAQVNVAGFSVLQSASTVQRMHVPVVPAAPAPPPIVQFDRPNNATVDVNIGTNFSPMRPRGNNFLVLVDPLPDVCRALGERYEKNLNVHFLCFAVSNYTGVTTFRRYNKENGGMSSSLAKVANGTSHEKFSNEVTLSTVMVVEALPLLRGILNNGNTIQRLKLDMQGFDYTVLRNLEPILSESPARIQNIMAECFYPNKAGKQIYEEVDNSCEKMKQYMESIGYTGRIVRSHEEWGDYFAYKAPATYLMDQSDFQSDWDNEPIRDGRLDNQTA